MNISKGERTAQEQAPWTLTTSKGNFRNLARHVQKLGLIYGFLLGCLTIICLLAGFVWFGALDHPAPWKVINAQDKRFEATKFRFTDYDSQQDLADVLHTLFPPGTEKTYVDKILVETAQAKITKFKKKDHFLTAPSDQRYYYSYNQPFRDILLRLRGVPRSEHIPTHHISIIYDEEDKVRKITVITP